MSATEMAATDPEVTTRTARVLVCAADGAVATLVEAALAERGTPGEVVSCRRPADLGGRLAGDAPYDVLVADDSLVTPSGLRRLRVVHEELPAMSLVLALHGPPEADLRDIIRAGAVDVLELPGDRRSVGAALARAIGIRDTIVHGTPPVIVEEPVREDAEPRADDEAERPEYGSQSMGNGLVAPRAVHPDDPEDRSDVAPPSTVPASTSKVITIASASGGCGKTFLATNLAWFLATHTGHRACIIDLDLQFGEVSSALRLRPRFTIAELIQRDGTEVADLADHIEAFTEVHESGVHVLAAPRDPAEASLIGPADVGRVIEAARQRFDHVVIDTPPALADTVIAAFNRSDELYVMATLDVPSVRNMRVFLGTLDRLQIPKDDIRLLLNKAERDAGVDVRQVLKLFPQGFDATLPYAREVNRSLNMGKAVLAVAPTAEISRQMTGALRRLLPPEAAARLDAATPKRGLFRRKSKDEEGS